MWYEYSIPADFNKQKEIIRKLRNWIQQLENHQFIEGFAFNHYYQVPPNPNEPDELRVRFEYRDEKNRDRIEKKLENEVRNLLLNYVKQQRTWGSDTTERHVLQAYEFGSRCAFLAWEQIENGRFPEDYFARASIIQGKVGAAAKRIPLEFQTHFNHGVMNSLGIPKKPDERAIHLRNLMESTNSRTKQELINWLQKNLKT